MRLRVRYLDGREPEIVTVSGSARHELESQQDSILAMTLQGKNSWADFLAWKTLQRRGDIAEDLDILDWLDTVEPIEYEMPEDKLLGVAELIGVFQSGEYDVVPKSGADPTGEPAGAPTPVAS